jgi:hypothetical protein
MQVSRSDYREVFFVYPDLSSGSNYNQFTDGPIDVSSGSPGYFGGTITFTTYRCKARIKIINPITLMGLGPVITGVEVGDYMLMFRREDKEQVDRVIEQKRAYMVADGERLRPVTVTYTGLSQSDECMAHCKKFDPEFKATGL